MDIPKLIRQATVGDLNARRDLAEHYGSLDTPEALKEYIRLTRWLARDGDALAQYNLGYAYSDRGRCSKKQTRRY